jgi:AGZA family xanthine/uracil permease-like MFS transporter
MARRYKDMSKQAHVPLWVKGDVDGFFGLFTNSLANTLTAIFLVSVVLQFPAQMTFGRIVPGIVLSLAFGNIYFAWMARRLGRNEKRDSVTAVPYGISVPHYFIVVFAVMLPLYRSTGNAELAWGVGVAWCFVHAVVAGLGAFVGPTLRRFTPRAAMLGTLAGVAITFIALGPAFQAWEVGWIGMISLGIIFIGWLANVKLPFKIPAGLMAILLGTIIGWVTGYMDPSGLQAAFADVRFGFPLPQFRALVVGVPHIAPYLVTAIPLAIYLFMETLNNVESAEAAGDSYNTREVMLAAAGGTLVASLFGSPFPTLVYIGHPGWKSVGARAGYSWGTGVAMLFLGIFGLLNVLLNTIPIVAILPILVYIGMVITSQAFSSTPRRHAPAVALALIPWMADWTKVQIDNALTAAGTSSAKLGAGALGAQGIFYEGMRILGSGSILVGMILAAITVFIIDKDYRGAIGYSVFGAACAFFGVIHAAQFGIAAAIGPTIGYASIAVICLIVRYTQGPTPAPVASEHAEDGKAER